MHEVDSAAADDVFDQSRSTGGRITTDGEAMICALVSTEDRRRGARLNPVVGDRLSRSRRRAVLPAALLASMLIGGACSNDEPSGAPTTAPPLGATLTSQVSTTLASVAATSATVPATTALTPTAPTSIARPATVTKDQLNNDDGYIPDGSTLQLSNTGYPAIANLDPALLSALKAAAADASVEGLEFRVNSAWRSPEYQQFLFDQAVAEYGSEQEARRWVSTPTESAHVTGDAVDLAPREVQDWLRQHGTQYGLCQAYANEAWHFELLAQPGEPCPVPIADAATG